MLWHSLDESGHIAVYDVKWPNGRVETNVPAIMLEGVKMTEHGDPPGGNNEAHGVQEKDTPIIYWIIRVKLTVVTAARSITLFADFLLRGKG